MKKNIGRISLITLLFLILACGTGWGYANTINISDDQGNWISGNGEISFDFSTFSLNYGDGFTRQDAEVRGNLGYDTFLGAITDGAYTLTATAGSESKTIDAGISLGLTNLARFFTSDIYVAHDDDSLMFFKDFGNDQYAYLGINLVGNGSLPNYTPCEGLNSLTFEGDVDIIYGQKCGTCNTPIPGAAWLLGSGLLGLVGIRRRKSDGEV